jgi:GAF domain-containing protein
VAGTRAIRSYAGCALRTPDGDLVGTLAVYDTRPLTLAPEQRMTLALIAEQIVACVEAQSRPMELALLSDAKPD